jgi:hypothetical protein
MTAPFRITLKADGHFDLEPVAGATPAAEEQALADAVAKQLERLADPEKAKGLPGDFATRLRAIAQTGLATAEGRDPARAAKDLRALVDGVKTTAAQAAYGRGPVAVGSFEISYNEDTEEIYVEPILDGPAPSDDQFAFLTQLVEQERLVKAIIDQGERNAAAAKEAKGLKAVQLMNAAKLALENAQPNLTLANLAMDTIVEDTMRKYGTKVREHYLWRMAETFLWSAFAILLAALVYLLIGHSGVLPEIFGLPLPKVAMLTVAMTAILAGAWLSSALRLRPDSPEVLSEIFAETLNVRIRAVLVLGFGFLVVILLHKGVVVVSFGGGNTGGISTTDVLSNLASAIVTGALLGLSERTLPNAIVERSANLIAALSKK